MALYPADSPWLHKPAAVAVAGRMIVESALAAQGFPGYLDLGGADIPRWLPPNRRENASLVREHELARSAFTAPEDNLVHAFRHLERSRTQVPPGSFVFVLSDFLVFPPQSVWRVGLSRGWDLVPVVVRKSPGRGDVPGRGRLPAPVGRAGTPDPAGGTRAA